MKYHDTHVHLEMLLERQELVSKGVREGMVMELSIEAKDFLETALDKHEFVVQSTVNITNFVQCQRLFAGLDKVWLLLGSHPEEVVQGFDLEQYLKHQRKLVESWGGVLPTRLVGIGEVGLDYHHGKESWQQEVQKELFSKQVELALELGLPLVIHCRNGEEVAGKKTAFEDLFAILDQYPAIFGRFLVHCFTGNVGELQGVLDRQGLVAFGGVITFGASADGVREAVKNCPTDSFVLETDLPFLSPNRGKVCMPVDIGQIAQKLGTIKGLGVEKVWEFSLENSQKLFFRVV